MMWSKRGLCGCGVLTAILVCCVPHVERAKPACNQNPRHRHGHCEGDLPTGCEVQVEPATERVFCRGIRNDHVPRRGGGVSTSFPDGILVSRHTSRFPTTKSLGIHPNRDRFRREDISPDRTAVSEHIADLSISKVQRARASRLVRIGLGLSTCAT